jgi:formylglycine-generating enzyme required for sulfatase activity
MHIELLPLQMIGHWESNPGLSQCEFQFGQRLIYVGHPSSSELEPYLRAAQPLAQAAWNDIEAVIAFAGRTLRPGEPELWQLLEAATFMGSPLEVFSIHIDAESGTMAYTLSWNPDFDWRQEVYDEFDTWKDSPISLQRFEPASDLWLSIRRICAGNFELEPAQIRVVAAQ